jgi:hypothetical protein
MWSATLLTLHLAAMPMPPTQLVPPLALAAAADAPPQEPPPPVSLFAAPVPQAQALQPPGLGFQVAEFGMASGIALGSELGVGLLTALAVVVLPGAPTGTCPSAAGVCIRTSAAQDTAMVFGLLAELIVPPLVAALLTSSVATSWSASHSVVGGLVGGGLGLVVAVAAVFVFPAIILASPLFIGAGVAVGMNAFNALESSPAPRTTVGLAPSTQVSLLSF